MRVKGKGFAPSSLPRHFGLCSSGRPLTRKGVLSPIPEYAIQGDMNVRSCLSLLGLVFVMVWPGFALAAISPIVFPVTLSEAVNVTGSPRILLDVGGNSRYAVYSAGSGTSTLSFSYNPTIGDVDLDGISVSAATIDLNGGTIQDLAGNDLTPLTFTAPDTSGVKVNYPSLSMDFVYDADGRYTLNGTAYDTLPAFLTAAGGTFSRGSVGTYYDSTGTLQTAASGAPRFDYDPVTHAAKGILIEESRINRTLYSQDFDNANWAPGAFVIANTTTAPDGSMTADTLSQANNATDFIRDQNISASANTTYTFSIFFKPGTRTNDFSVMLDWADFSSLRVTLAYTYASNLVSTGGSGASRINNAVVQVLSNGWYRLALTFTTDTTVGHIVSMIGRYGNSTGTTYIWGAQLEQGSFATSYIPTTTAAVTRQMDVLTIPTGSWFSTSGGAYYSSFFSNYNTSQTYYTRIVGDGTSSSSFLGLGSSFSQLQTWNGTYINAAFSPPVSTSTPVKSAVSWSSTGLTRSLVGNGGTVSTGSFSGSYSPTSIRIGSSAGQNNPPNAPIEAVKYYPIRPTDTQLQLLTQ